MFSEITFYNYIYSHFTNVFQIEILIFHFEITPKKNHILILDFGNFLKNMLFNFENFKIINFDFKV